MSSGPTEAEFETAQTEFHRSSDPRRFLNRMRNPFIGARERRLAEAILSADGDRALRLLDLGSGEGANYTFLHEVAPGMRYVGLDFSFGKTVFFREYLPEASVVCGDALDLPFADDLFDIVLVRDVIHHVDTARRRAVAEAARVTRPGGKVIVIEGNGRSLLNRIFQALSPVERGMANSTPSSVTRLCEAFGATEVAFLEPVQLVRAIAFFLGWPRRALRPLVWPAYVLADLFERLVGRLLPRRRWSYYMVTIGAG